jgi:hypothetical protein
MRRKMEITSPRTALAGLGLVVVLGTTPVAIAAARGPAGPSASPTAKRSSVDTGQLSTLARTLHISVPQLSAGLTAAKLAGGAGPAGITAFSRATGASPQIATRAVTSIFGPGSGGGITSPAAVTALAHRLHVSQAAAADALTRLAALGSAQGGVDPTSPEFLALAHRLAVAPQDLGSALAAAKVASGR